VKIVFNSSPLIFLARLGFIEDVIKYFDNDNLYLPTVVADEIAVKTDQASISIKHLIESHQLDVKNVKLFSLANRLKERLGKGESEAIVLGIELQTDYLILDDAAARKEAMRLGLNVKGTLAIIRMLKQEGKITLENLEEFYKKLIEIKFWVNKRLFEQIFRD
jgi:predicted nucleic acid-binding protein